MWIRILGIALLAATMLTVGGCNTNGCLENRNSVPLAGFYSYETGASVGFDSLQITGEGMPETDPLLAVRDNSKQVYMPMRSTDGVTSWVFAYKWRETADPENNDTLTFVYDSTPFFASEECGVIFKYRIRQVRYTHHLIDSVGISDSLITNQDIEQIQIYFATR